MENKDFIKQEDGRAREWLDINFLPKKRKCIPRLEWTPDQFNPFDAKFTASTLEEYLLELKTRHKLSTDYSGQTFIEADKFNSMWEHRGEVALLILFQDCICYFPPSRLFDAFSGIGVGWNCPDEMHPSTTKKWGYRTKAVAYFDTNKAVKFDYDDYGGKPDFV